MNIEMRDMGFGEMVVLTENNDKFIIDCGYSSRKYAVDENEFLTHDNGKVNLLITHFHDDHYKAILQDNIDESKVYFEHCYLSPLYYRKSSKELLSILTTISPVYSRGKREIDNLILLLEKIFKISDSIHFLKRGDSIKICSKKFNVLWPEYDIEYDIEDEEYTLINEFMAENESFLNNSNEVRRLLERFVQQLDDILNDYENNEKTNNNLINLISKLKVTYEDLRKMDLYTVPSIKIKYKKY